MSMKIFNGIIGNRTRDLPACSTVPKPTEPTQVMTLHIVDLYQRVIKNNDEG
jgi:hypothetical protein